MTTTLAARPGRLLVRVAVISGPAAEMSTTVSTSDQGALLTNCLLYTSDAADDLLCVDLGGRRFIKKTKTQTTDSKTLRNLLLTH